MQIECLVTYITMILPAGWMANREKSLFQGKKNENHNVLHNSTLRVQRSLPQLQIYQLAIIYLNISIINKYNWQNLKRQQNEWRIFFLLCS